MHVVRRGGDEEAEHQREHQEVGERHAEIEQQDRGDQQRHREALLAPVQAGRDERPDLVEHIGHRDQQSGDERQLQRRGEGRGHRGGDQLLPGGSLATSGLREQIEQPIGVERAREGRRSSPR